MEEKELKRKIELLKMAMMFKPISTKDLKIVYDEILTILSVKNPD